MATVHGGIGGEGVELDTGAAHPARVYDYWLGGKDNYPADRELAELMIQAIPNMRAMARANRDFLRRAARYLTGVAGIRQFLDIGTGIPTSPNLHEVAQGIAPEARVLYVDNDPIVLTHAQALMTSSSAGRTAFILGDFLEPATILDDPTLTATLDLGEPVALMLVAILMYFRDSQDPYGIVARLLEPLPAGSFLAVTHPTADFDAPAVAAAVAAAEHAGITLVPRSHDEVAAFFERAGLELVEPGVAPLLAWQPTGEPPAEPESVYYWAGIGRKP